MPNLEDIHALNSDDIHGLPEVVPLVIKDSAPHHFNRTHNRLSSRLKQKKKISNIEPNGALAIIT